MSGQLENEFYRSMRTGPHGCYLPEPSYGTKISQPGHLRVESKKDFVIGDVDLFDNYLEVRDFKQRVMKIAENDEKVQRWLEKEGSLFF